MARATRQVSQHRRLDGEIAGGNDGFGEAFFLVKFRNIVVAEGGKFIQPGVADAAADDHGALYAKSLQNAREDGAQRRMRYANELRGGPGGIKERAEEIEDGALAATGADFAGGAGVAHGGIIERREEEGEMM